MSAPAAAPHPYRGIVLFMLGLMLFAAMDSSTKYLVAHYPVPLVVAVRYVVNCLLMILLLAPSQGRAMIRTQRTGLVIVRSICLAAASLFMSLALQRMPVAETTAIAFLSPLLVTLLAGPLLGERAGMLGWVAVIGGFGGILLIANPGAGLDPMGTLFALAAAAAMAAYQLLSRMLAGTEKTVPMLFYTTLVGSAVFGLYLPWSWGGDTPTTLQLLLFVAIGALGGLGHFLFTAAYRDTGATVLAPMIYAQLIWAGLLGWLVFDHVPTHMSIAGMVIVALSGAMVAIKSRFTRRGPVEPLE